MPKNRSQNKNRAKNDQFWTKDFSDPLWKVWGMGCNGKDQDFKSFQREAASPVTWEILRGEALYFNWIVLCGSTYRHILQLTTCFSILSWKRRKMQLVHGWIKWTLLSRICSQRFAPSYAPSELWTLASFFCQECISEDSQKNLLSLTRISVVIVKIAKVVLGIRELGHLLSICALDLGVGANVIIHTFTRR